MNQEQAEKLKAFLDVYLINFITEIVPNASDPQELAIRITGGDGETHYIWNMRNLADFIEDEWIT